MLRPLRLRLQYLGLHRSQGLEDRFPFDPDACHRGARAVVVEARHSAETDAPLRLRGQESTGGVPVARRDLEFAAAAQPEAGGVSEFFSGSPAANRT